MVIIYDPTDFNFYQKKFIIEPRKGEIRSQILAEDPKMAIRGYKLKTEEYVDILDYEPFIWRGLEFESTDKINELF